jgi:UPF0716 protein FxsA
MALLALVFIVVPLVELTVIVQVGRAIGALETIALVVVVSVAGAALARHQGLGVLTRLRDQVRAGQVPTNELIDGALVLAGGLLLCTPGFVTDGIGIVALLPPTRALLRGYLRRRFRLVAVGRLGTTRSGPDDVIDV